MIGDFKKTLKLDERLPRAVYNRDAAVILEH